MYSTDGRRHTTETETVRMKVALSERWWGSMVRGGVSSATTPTALIGCQGEEADDGRAGGWNGHFG